MPDNQISPETQRNLDIINSMRQSREQAEFNLNPPTQEANSINIINAFSNSRDIAERNLAVLERSGINNPQLNLWNMAPSSLNNNSSNSRSSTNGNRNRGGSGNRGSNRQPQSIIVEPQKAETTTQQIMQSQQQQRDLLFQNAQIQAEAKQRDANYFQYKNISPQTQRNLDIINSMSQSKTQAELNLYPSTQEVTSLGLINALSNSKDIAQSNLGVLERSGIDKPQINLLNVSPFILSDKTNKDESKTKQYSSFIGNDSNSLFQKQSIGSEFIFSPILSTAKTIDYFSGNLFDKPSKEFEMNYPLFSKGVRVGAGVGDFFLSGAIVGSAIGNAGTGRYTYKNIASEMTEPSFNIKPVELSKDPMFINLNKGGSSVNQNVLVSEIKQFKTDNFRILDKSKPEKKVKEIEGLDLSSDLMESSFNIKPVELSKEPMFINLNKGGSSVNQNSLISDFKTLEFKEAKSRGLLFTNQQKININLPKQFNLEFKQPSSSKGLVSDFKTLEFKEAKSRGLLFSKQEKININLPKQFNLEFKQPSSSKISQPSFNIKMQKSFEGVKPFYRPLSFVKSTDYFTEYNKRKVELNKQLTMGSFRQDFKQDLKNDFEMDFKQDFKNDFGMDFRQDFKQDFRIDFKQDFRQDFKQDFKNDFKLKMNSYPIPFLPSFELGGEGIKKKKKKRKGGIKNIIAPSFTGIVGNFKIKSPIRESKRFGISPFQLRGLPRFRGKYVK